MRADSFGFYWEDAPVIRGRNSYPLHLAAIPETGWVAPDTFPNLRNVKLLSLDCETKDPNLRDMGPGFRRKDAHICGISVGVETGERWYFPMRHEVSPEENLNPDAVLAWARDNLCIPGQAKVGANLGYDVDALWSEGVRVTGPFYDVQYAEALLDENKRSYSLENIAKQYLNEGKVGDVLKKWVEKSYGDHEPYRANIYRSPPSLVGPYAEGDADLPLRIFAMQRRELAAQGLTDLFAMETELLPQLIRMRQRGVRVDIDGAKLLDDQLSAGILDFDKQLKSLAGRVVDVNSAVDLAKVFDAAGVHYGTTATGKPSFTKLFLEQCEHPIAQMIVERRKLEKYQSTFIRGYILGMNVDGRIHALFHPLKGDENGTVSGRFSSSLPNLTNIPARDAIWGPRIRGLFLPEIDEDWGRHDYSQIEYRFLAHYAQGPSAAAVQERYRKDPDTDFHVMAQDLIYDVTGTLLDRKPVKNINFGLCIAEGQRVLTHRGYVAIETVVPTDKLWDGIEWVEHDGLVYMGEKEVITYDGLTATPDHEVWTDECGKLPMRRAASEGLTLTRPRSTSEPCTEKHDTFSSAGVVLQARQKVLLANCLLRMRKNGRKTYRQLQEAASMQLPARKVFRSTVDNARAQVRGNASALQFNHARKRQELSSQRHKATVRKSRAFYTLGSSNVSRFRLQGAGFRPYRQQWELRAGKLAPSHQSGKPTEQTALVYDIMNAGPRHRFICEGVLVSNCYGMGKPKLVNNLGITAEQGEELFAAYHKGVPFVKATYNSVQDRANDKGYIRTVLNRRARFALFESANGAQQGPALPEIQAVAKYGRVRRAYTHKALNRLLQGSAADLLKKAMVMIGRSGVEDVLGPLLLTCHDETGNSVPRTAAGRQALDEVRNIMQTCMKLKVPVLADQSIGANWGECK